MYTKKRIYVFCNIVLVLLNIFGCGINIDEKRYESSPSTSPATESGSATLTWQAPVTDAHGSPLYDLGGYKIYYRMSSSDYTRSIDVGNFTSIDFTSIVISNLSPGRWCFSVTAYDTSGNESHYSNEMCKTI